MAAVVAVLGASICDSNGYRSGSIDPYSLTIPVDERCEIVIEGEGMELVKESKYLGTVLSRHEEMEEES